MLESRDILAAGNEEGDKQVYRLLVLDGHDFRRRNNQEARLEERDSMLDDGLDMVTMPGAVGPGVTVDVLTMIFSCSSVVTLFEEGISMQF